MEKTRKCKKCGTLNDEDSEFCTSCGNTLNSKEPLINRINFPFKKKNILILIGIVIIAISAITLATFLIEPNFIDKNFEGTTILLPENSNFVNSGGSVYKDAKSNITVELLKSPNEVIDARASNKNETFASNNSNIINFYYDTIIVSDKNNNYGVKISNVDEDFLMKIAESVILSPMQTEKMSGESVKSIISKGLSDYSIIGRYPHYKTFSINSMALVKYSDNKDVYKVNVNLYTFQGTYYSSWYEVNIYVDAYTGKIVSKQPVNPNANQV